MNPAIEVKGLTFCYDSRPVFRNLAFRIFEGERVAILGSNGAGKSTLLWCLVGLLRPQGEVTLLGRKAGKNNRARIGMVFQNPEDQLFMPSILEDLTLPLLNRGIPREDARLMAETALLSAGLGDHAGKPASQISLGQRKRAAITLALSGSPELLILDEPTAELDGRSCRELAEALRSLTCTCLMASHHLEFVRSLATRILVLEGGLLAADGPAPEILADNALLSSAGLI